MYSPWFALFVYTVAQFGLVYILGHSRITLPVRQAWADTGGAPLFLELVECPMCLGFWIGVIAGAVAFALGDHAVAVALPFYTSGSNYIIGRQTGLVREE